jgi:uncharacterized protein (DUF697 family)
MDTIITKIKIWVGSKIVSRIKTAAAAKTSSLIRAGAQMAAASLLASGFITDEQFRQLVGIGGEIATSAAALVVIAITVAWGYIEKKYFHVAIEEAAKTDPAAVSSPEDLQKIIKDIQAAIQNGGKI